MDIDEPDKFNGDDFFVTIEPMTKNMYRTKKRILGIKNDLARLRMLDSRQQCERRGQVEAANGW